MQGPVPEKNIRPKPVNLCYLQDETKRPYKVKDYIYMDKIILFFLAFPNRFSIRQALTGHYRRTGQQTALGFPCPHSCLIRLTDTKKACPVREHA